MSFGLRGCGLYIELGWMNGECRLLLNPVRFSVSWRFDYTSLNLCTSVKHKTSATNDLRVFQKGIVYLCEYSNNV